MGDLNTKNNGQPIQPDGACRGAANHAYDGTTGDRKFWIEEEWEAVKIYEATDDPSIPPETPLITTGLNRKDVFVMGGNCWHVSTCLEGTTVWEYGFRTNPNKWGTATLEEYINLTNENGWRVVKYIIQYKYPGN